MKIRFQDVFELLKSAGRDWNEDKASRLAAALAYYAAVSLAPMLVVTLGIAALAVGREAATIEIKGQIQALVGPHGAAVIQDIIANSDKPAESILSVVLGSTILLLGASGVFGALQDGLNTVWEV